jgi:hypothetical protein
MAAAGTVAVAIPLHPAMKPGLLLTRSRHKLPFANKPTI